MLKEEQKKNCRIRQTANLSKYVDCMWNMTKSNTRSFFCMLADLIDILQLVCIQNQIKREKELYKLHPASSATVTLIVRGKLTFTLPL